MQPATAIGGDTQCMKLVSKCVHTACKCPQRLCKRPRTRRDLRNQCLRSPPQPTVRKRSERAPTATCSASREAADGMRWFHGPKQISIARGRPPTRPVYDQYEAVWGERV